MCCSRSGSTMSVAERFTATSMRRPARMPVRPAGAARVPSTQRVKARRCAGALGDRDELRRRHECRTPDAASAPAPRRCAMRRSARRSFGWYTRCSASLASAAAGPRRSSGGDAAPRRRRARRSYAMLVRSIAASIGGLRAAQRFRWQLRCPVGARATPSTTAACSEIPAVCSGGSATARDLRASRRHPRLAAGSIDQHHEARRVDARHESVVALPARQLLRQVPDQLVRDIEAQPGGEFLQVGDDQHDDGRSRSSGTAPAGALPAILPHAAVGQAGGVVMTRHMQQARLALCDAALHAVERVGQVREFAPARGIHGVRVVAGGNARAPAASRCTGRAALRPR